MGLFERNKAAVPDPAAALAAHQLFQEASQFPPAAIARIVASQDHPMVILAHSILLLVESGVVEREALQLIGIDSSEIVRLVSSFAEADSVQGVQEAMATHAAVAFYHAQISEIFSDKFMILSEEQRETFTKNVAWFAAENELTDLRVAHRLMVAEGLDPLNDKQ
jgi:hypothetical protein